MASVATPEDRDESVRVRRTFLALWGLLGLIKLVLIVRLPLFVDEAFYWQEGQHLAWVYSDVPGATAWLTRLGVLVLGTTPLGVRWPFWMIGLLLPWLLVRLTARVFDPATAWRAGILFLLLPLAGTLGVLALPDVLLLLATLLCLDACVRMLRTVDAMAVTSLAAGLVLGALTHYRFAIVPLVGGLVLCGLPEGRRVLRQRWVWLAVGAGVLAWLPVLWWNLQHGDVGWRFQLQERHPWTFSPDGWRRGGGQGLLVTPLLLIAMLQACVRNLRGQAPQVRLLAWCGGLVVVGFFVLGFFADRQRVSFHWPLPGHVALLPLVPAVLAQWRPFWRHAAMVLAGLGLVLALAYCLMAATATGRHWAAGHGLYPDNFSDWQGMAGQVRQMRAQAGGARRLLAADFKLGAELGFALGDADIAVLDHPLNHKHGRHAQLVAWQLLMPGAMVQAASAHWLLVATPMHAGFEDTDAYWRWLCQQVGGLPMPQVVDLDGGGKRVWLFLLDPGKRQADHCGPLPPVVMATGSRPDAADAPLQSAANR